MPDPMPHPIRASMAGAFSEARERGFEKGFYRVLAIEAQGKEKSAPLPRCSLPTPRNAVSTWTRPNAASRCGMKSSRR